MMKKRKELLKKKPTRNSQKKYWTETDFDKLKLAPPARLYSKGPLPWRLLAYLLKVSPEVDTIRTVVRKRLLDQPRIEAGMKQLNRMLMILRERGMVTLEPEPPPPPAEGEPTPDYQPTRAVPTPALDTLLVFRAVHPLYGAFLVEHLGKANRVERLQAFESVLELPRPLLKFVRVPWDMPFGPLESELTPELIARGLVAAEPEPGEGDEEDDRRFIPWDERPPVFAQKLRLLFDATNPEVTDVSTEPVWCAAELLNLGGNFNTYITSRDLNKQEGIVFRHLLRLILLTDEFAQLTPPGCDPAEWRADLADVAARLTESCRQVDPASTEQTIQKARAADVVEGESHAALTAEAAQELADAEFGAGLDE